METKETHETVHKSRRYYKTLNYLNSTQIKKNTDQKRAMEQALWFQINLLHTVTLEMNFKGLKNSMNPIRRKTNQKYYSSHQWATR